CRCGDCGVDRGNSRKYCGRKDHLHQPGRQCACWTTGQVQWASTRKPESCWSRSARAELARPRPNEEVSRDMNRRRRALVVALSAMALATTTAPLAGANPTPPTNGGNGAGKSGQCTGPNAERPHSCKSQGGPGNQP